MLQQASLIIGIVSNVCTLAEHVGDRSREAYKYVLSPQKLVVQFYPLAMQSRAGLRFEEPDRFFPLTYWISAVLTSKVTLWTDKLESACENVIPPGPVCHHVSRSKKQIWVSRSKYHTNICPPEQPTTVPP